MVFKCKMCGGDLDINQEMRICECQYCGSKQTLPKMGDEKRNNMFDRAGHFRRNNEYDKAMSLYEQILNEESEDAEVYWSLVLCRYGIEYVEDPVSHKRIPTINRMQYNSILSDADYQAALKYADGQQRVIYEEEAKEIDRIQKGILAISSKEDPFDVFICYKESDANGRRTPDSVLANDLYHQLTQEGFKVFFARITLEDKLGSAYEPYIFAALNSAKVMVVLGTKPEYFNAVWVKNEWSRYLSLIKGGAKKVLIPAYKDMDPYDLPEAFSHLQAQDMSKRGFMQDLIRGIKKLTDTDKKPESSPVQVVAAGNGAQALVERAFLFLEDGDFSKADELCEQALNQDPKNAQAYVGKLMVEKRVRKQEELSEGTDSLTNNNYFQKAIRFAEDGLKAELERCNQMVFDNAKDKEYISASDLVKQSNVSGSVEQAINLLNQAISKYNGLVGWKESESKIAECSTKKEELIKGVYEKAQAFQGEGEDKKARLEFAIEKLEMAVQEYRSIAGFRKVSDEIKTCEDKLLSLYAIRDKARMQKSLRIAVPLVAVVIVLAVAGIIMKQHSDYKKAYEEAYEKAYAEVVLKVEEGDYASAVSAAGEYLKQDEVEQLFYKFVKEKIENGEYEVAITLLTENSEYKDAEELIQEAKYELANQYMTAEEYEQAKVLYENLNGYENSDELVVEATYQIANQYLKRGCYEESADCYESINGYKDSDELWKVAIYRMANSKLLAHEYETAEKLFESISGYKDSDELMQKAIFSKEVPDWLSVNEVMRGVITTVYEDKLPSSIEIPSCVTEIGANAFQSCSDLESVTIPDSVTEIGDEAFFYCFRLTSVTIPDSVTKIGDGTFDGCSNLTSVTISEGVTIIGDRAFQSCSNLTSVTIPDSVTEIGCYAFNFCKNLTSVIIPDSVTKIGANAFQSCSNLTSVTIPGSVTKIGDSTFGGCENLTSVTIPDSVTEIGDSTFYDCENLTSVTIPDSVTEIGSNAFKCTPLEGLY